MGNENKPKNPSRQDFQQHRALVEQIRHLNTLEKNINALDPQRRVSLYPTHDVHTRILGGPPTLLEVLSQRETYSAALALIRKLLTEASPVVISLCRQTIDIVEKNSAADPITHKINGTSLDEVAMMPLPLDTNDIKKIDAMINKTAKPGRVKNSPLPDPNVFVQQTIIFAAAQAELNRTVHLSTPAKLLIERLKSYWEYYTSWTLDSSQGNELLVKLLTNDALTRGLLTFMPARLHISPSSIYRMFDEHVEQLDALFLTNRVRQSYRRSLLTEMAHFLKGIPAPKGLPQQMEPYQFTDPESEVKLTKKLQEGYNVREIPTQVKDGIDLEAATESLVKTLSVLYHRQIRESLQRSSEGLLRVPCLPDNFFKEVLVTTLYGRTLNIVGLASDGTYVTLDLMQSGRLFGIPPQFLSHNLAQAQRVVHDILEPVLSEAKNRYPWIEAKPTPRTPRSIVTPTEPIQQTPPNPLKRKAQGALQKLRGNPSPSPQFTEPLPQEEEEKETYMLIYKGKIIESEEIEELAAKVANNLIPNDSRLVYDMVLIYEALSHDPYGPGTYKLSGIPPVTEGDFKMHLRSFRGDTKRLPFQNKPYSDKLRTVYYIDPRNKAVHFVETLTHKIFSVKYSKNANH